MPDWKSRQPNTIRRRLAVSIGAIIFVIVVVNFAAKKYEAYPGMALAPVSAGSISDSAGRPLEARWLVEGRSCEILDSGTREIISSWPSSPEKGCRLADALILGPASTHEK
jgi:hypothetical protein